MPKINQEIQKQNEEENQTKNNHKFKYVKQINNKLRQKNQADIYNNKIKKNINSVKDSNINIKKKSFKNETRKNNNSDDNLEVNEENAINGGVNNENLLDSETFIIDDIDSIEKPPNALEINDLLGEKCEINLDILSINFTNFEPSKTSSKTMGMVKAYGANTYQGLVRNYNEDRVSIIINMAKPHNYQKKYWPKTSFFGIYDGHGGNMCSEFLRDCLHKLILNDINFPENVELAIKNGFFNAEKNFLNDIALDPKDKNIISDRSGSCAVIVLVVDKKIYVANVGDSRALFSENKGKNIVVVTEDHKPNNIKEKNRIIKSGGHVYQSRTVISGAENENLNGQILFGPYRVLPGRLSVSRTIGDIEAKNEKFGGNPKVIIWEPDIFVYDLNKINIDFFIMGCDGIFDQMSNEEVMDCAWMVLNNGNSINNNKEDAKGNNDDESSEYNFDNANIHEKCGLIVDFIIKSSMVRKSFDNVTCLMIAFNDFTHKEKKINQISKDEYLKNIYRLNNSEINNETNNHIKKSNKVINDNNNNNNDIKKKKENINRKKEQNISDNDISHNCIVSDINNKNLNNISIGDNNNKEVQKNVIKANLKLTNFINLKNNTGNISSDILPRTYRNTDSIVSSKRNHNSNTTINNISNNNVYIKKRQERNLAKKSVNKTTDINNSDDNENNTHSVKKKIINKLVTHRTRKIVDNNNIRMQSLNNNLQGRKKRITIGNIKNKLDVSQSQNDLSNHLYSQNKSKNDSATLNLNKNIIQKLKQNKINKIPLELNNKLIESTNNNPNVHFYYSNTYTNKYKKLPYLKTNSISNISSQSSNINHLTTSNATISSLNCKFRPKKLKNLTKPKTFRYNDSNLNKFKNSFYKNRFLCNRNQSQYDNKSHNINNISEQNCLNINNNITYSQNNIVKIKEKKRETMTSKKKKFSFHKVIKTLGLNGDNAAKNKVKKSNGQKVSYSKEKDIKNFLYKNKTNIVSGQNNNINHNNKYLKKNNLYKF